MYTQSVGSYFYSYVGTFEVEVITLLPSGLIKYKVYVWNKCKNEVNLLTQWQRIQNPKEMRYGPKR